MVRIILKRKRAA